MGVIGGFFNGDYEHPAQFLDGADATQLYVLLV
jgi:hypothetical protein